MQKSERRPAGGAAQSNHCEKRISRRAATDRRLWKTSFGLPFCGRPVGRL
jgi:hypothetical protein